MKGEGAKHKNICATERDEKALGYSSWHELPQRLNPISRAKKQQQQQQQEEGECKRWSEVG